MTISTIGDSCTGCGACSNVCSHNAITMQESSEGFVIPVITPERCIDCGLCYKLCPYNSDQSNDSSFRNRAYLVTSSDKQLYYYSATIGLCTLLSRLVIESGGVVFGAELNEKDWIVRHVLIDTVEGLDRIRNSKYVQSDVSESFGLILNLLRKTDKLVLFIGTPCQVAGLKSVLRKNYDNLFTIDLVCHGVYSHKLLSKEVEYWQSKFGGTISNFRFRSKRVYPWIKGGVINFDLRKHFHSKHIEIPGPYSPTYRCYAYSPDGINYNLRQSCYKCNFRSEFRYGDLSIGDAWFVSQYMPEVFTEDNCRKGISLFFVNTEKGEEWAKSLYKYAKFFDVPYEYMYIQPALLPADRQIPLQRKELYDNINIEDYGRLVNRLLNVDIDSLYTEYVNSNRISVSRRIKDRIRVIRNRLKKYGVE